MKRIILAVAFFLLAVPLFAANQPVLTWTASTTAGVGYRIYRSTASGQESTTSINANPVAVGCSGASCTYTDTDALTPGTTYFYIVRAVLGTQNSGPSNEASVLIPVVIVIPAAPNGLVITIK